MALQQRTLGHERLTYADLREFPDDGKRYEVLDGELAVTAAPTSMHQRVSVALVELLGEHVRRGRLGRLFHAPLDVILAEDCVVEPDLVFVAKSHERIIKRHGIEGAPDLVVEILSRGTERRDRTIKATLYARFGIPIYWIIDPEKRTLEIYARGKRRYRRVARYAGSDEVNAPPFQELRFALRELWA